MLSAFLLEIMLGIMIPPIVAFEIITIVYLPEFEFAETAISATNKENALAEMETP